MFVRTKDFPRFARIFMRYLSDSRHVDQGKLGKMDRESHEIQMELTGGNPE